MHGNGQVSPIFARSQQRYPRKRNLLPPRWGAMAVFWLSEPQKDFRRNFWHQQIHQIFGGAEKIDQKIAKVGERAQKWFRACLERSRKLQEAKYQKEWRRR